MSKIYKLVEKVEKDNAFVFESPSGERLTIKDTPNKKEWTYIVVGNVRRGKRLLDALEWRGFIIEVGESIVI